MKRVMLFFMSIIIILFVACAPREPVDTTKPVTGETVEPRLQASEDTKIKNMEELISQIVIQVVNGDISIDTISELENMGIDSKVITAFKETVVSTEDNTYFRDGTYKGTGDAHNGDIVVEVTIYNGKIIYIEAVEHSETAPLLEQVFKSIPLEIFKEQSVQDVDTVSGATESSNGYIQAIEEALSKAQR